MFLIVWCAFWISQPSEQKSTNNLYYYASILQDNTCNANVKLYWKHFSYFFRLFSITPIFEVHPSTRYEKNVSFSHLVYLTYCYIISRLWRRVNALRAGLRVRWEGLGWEEPGGLNGVHFYLRLDY